MAALALGTAVAFAQLMAATATTTVDHGKFVGCYWGTWSVYRNGDGKYDVGNFDASLCTHGFYGFADMSDKSWELVAYDPWFDMAANDCSPGQCYYDGFRRFVALAEEHPNFTPILSVGGWNAGSGKFSEMAADPEKKQIFLNSVIPFLTKFGFKGLDFDWEYPGSREGSDPARDKDNYSALVEELSQMLHAKGLILTAALSSGRKTIDSAYDIPRISKAFDYMNVMCYDYHGWWYNHSFTGHNSPLYGREEENYEGHPGYLFNVYDGITYFIEQGAPREKLALGMPAYGRGFKLGGNWEGVSETENGLYCPSIEGIPAGPYTMQNGIWGFHEILRAFKNDTLVGLPGGKPHDWKVTRDDCYKAPYAVNGPYWIGYDDQTSIAYKVQFINFLGIAGGFVWSTDTDDFSGKSSNETYPILRTINKELAAGTKLDPSACSGSAPMCDLFDKPTGYECKEVGEVYPFPGDCHKYYLCMEGENESFNVQVFDCGSYLFDPAVSACINPGLPGNDLLCGQKLFFMEEQQP